MIVTKEWIERFCTEGGGWTAAQLRILGVSWPPKKGWKERSVGREISEPDRLEFQRLYLVQQIKRQNKGKPVSWRKDPELFA